MSPGSLQDMLIEAIAAFPVRFYVRDRRGPVRVVPSRSRVDPATREIVLAVFDAKDELVGEFSPAELRRVCARAARGPDPDSAAPAVRTPRRPKRQAVRRHRESYIDTARRLILSRATQEEMIRVFRQLLKSSRITGHQCRTDMATVKWRILLNCRLARQRFPDVMEAWKAQRRERRADGHPAPGPVPAWERRERRAERRILREQAAKARRAGSEKGRRRK